jgi:hypothetical protein
VTYPIGHHYGPASIPSPIGQHYLDSATSQSRAHVNALHAGRTSPAARRLYENAGHAPAGYVLYLLQAATRELTTGEACDFCGAGYGTAQARDEDAELLTLCTGCWADYPGFLTPERWHPSVWDDDFAEQGYRDEDIDGPRAHLDR